MNPLSASTPPASLRIVPHSDPFNLAISCSWPRTGSDTNVTRPSRVVIIKEPCPVVLYFPAHKSDAAAQDQHGHNVPSTRAIAPLVASAASSAVGRESAVACSISGVRQVMYREIVDWSTSKISAHTSSVMLCRTYPLATTSASRNVSSLGRPLGLRHGPPSSSPTRR